MRKIKVKIRYNRILLCVLPAALLLAAEVILRITMPMLGEGLFSDYKDYPSAQIDDDTKYYEPKPYTAIGQEKPGSRFSIKETLSSEGFRGPEYLVPKPKDTLRILAIGDSIVQSEWVIYDKTWERILEEKLSLYAFNSGSSLAYEVINAGVGGYVSWQAASRLKLRGLKYKPDVVLVLVGWNDLLFSSIASWKRGMGLVEFDRFRKEQYELSQRSKKNRLFTKIRMPFYHISYIARLIREFRYKILKECNIRKEVAEHKIDSGLPFNEEALELYVANLKDIYDTNKANNIRMALITLPTIINLKLLNDYDISSRASLIYFNSPLSTYELWVWYKRYVGAQRVFAVSYPDVVLIDAAKALEKKDKKERLLMFKDMVHLSEYGSQEFANIIFDEMNKRGVI